MVEAKKACESIKNKYKNKLCELNGVIPCEKQCIKEEAEKYLSWIVRDRYGMIKIDGGWEKEIIISRKVNEISVDTNRENRWRNKELVFEDLKKEIFKYIDQGKKVEISGLGYWLTL